MNICFKVKLKIILYFFIIPILLFANSDTANAVDKVKLKLKWQHQFQFAGYYAAKEKGFYKNAGLDVEFIETSNAEDTSSIKYVLNGKAEFGVSSSDLVIHRVKGKPVVALAAIFQHSPLIFLFKDESKIKFPNDLIGKKIMLEDNSEELRVYLLKENVKYESAISLYPHRFDTEDLINGKVDAISAYATDEPFELKVKKILYSSFGPRNSGFDFYGDVLFTTNDYLIEFPEIVDAFVGASLKGWKYALKHEDEIINTIIKKYKTNHSVEHLKYEANEMKRYIADDGNIGAMNIDRWKNIATYFSNFDFISNKFCLDGFLYAPNIQKTEHWYHAIFWWAIGLGIAIIFSLMAMLRFSHFIVRFFEDLSSSKRGKDE